MKNQDQGYEFEIVFKYETKIYSPRDNLIPERNRIFCYRAKRHLQQNISYYQQQNLPTLIYIALT